MSKSDVDSKQLEFVRALEEVRDYLEFSAEKAEYLHNEHYLAVRNYLEQLLKEIQVQQSCVDG